MLKRSPVSCAMVSFSRMPLRRRAWVNKVRRALPNCGTLCGMRSKLSYTAVEVRVDAVRDLCPSMRRVTLSGEGLKKAAPLCLDRRIKLVLPRYHGDALEDIPRIPGWYDALVSLPPSDQPSVRTYTARAMRPDMAELDVDVVRHGTSGPAGRWIETVAAGDRLVVAVPRADFKDIDTIGLAWHPGSAKQILVAGDETAAPAIANIAASLAPDAVGTILIEMPTPEDAWPLTVPPGVDVRVLCREGEAPGSLLERELYTLTWPPEAAESVAVDDLDDDAGILWDEPAGDADGEHFAWLAGEKGAVQRMRRFLVRERGCPRDRVAFMSYWRQGHAES